MSPIAIASPLVQSKHRLLRRAIFLYPA